MKISDKTDEDVAAILGLISQTIAVEGSGSNPAQRQSLRAGLAKRAGAGLAVAVLGVSSLIGWSALHEANGGASIRFNHEKARSFANVVLEAPHRSAASATVAQLQDAALGEALKEGAALPSLLRRKALDGRTRAALTRAVGPRAGAKPGQSRRSLSPVPDGQGGCGAPAGGAADPSTRRLGRGLPPKRIGKPQLCIDARCTG